MTVAFTDESFDDLIYELNDGELINDVLMIVGESGSEVLVRGYDSSSILKYGRRSYRIDKAIIEDSAPSYTVSKAQITEILDRNIEPYPVLTGTIISKEDTLISVLLALEISDLVTVTNTTLCMSSVYFIVESIDLSVDKKGHITGTIGLVQARSSEHP